MKRVEIFNEKILQFSASLLSLGHKTRRKDISVLQARQFCNP